MALAKPADFVVGTDPGIYVIVHVDGKSLESPVNVRLPPGEYQVRFENKKLGFDQTTTVVVGGTTTLVKFHVAKGVNNKLVLERRSIVVEDLSGVPVIDDADEMPIVGD